VLGMRQDMRLQQRLAPQLIQSLHLLQLPALDLEQLVRQELEINPLLEELPLEEAEQLQEQDTEDPPDTDADSGDSDDSASDEDGDFETETSESEERDTEAPEVPDTPDDFSAEEWSNFLDDTADLANSFREERDYGAEIYEPVTVYEETLAEDLLEQLRFVTSDPLDAEIGEYIIGNFDEDGFLQATIEEMSEVLDQPAARLEKVLAIIQTFDPPGVGARDLRESLLIQLRDKKLVDHPAYTIVECCFDELMHKRTKEIQRQLKVTKEDISETLELVSQLNPRPAAADHGDAQRTIIPDLIVERVDNEYVIMLNDRSVPSLRISPNYRDFLQGTDDAKQYVVDRLNSAKWLIKSIEQRRQTMLKVMNAIVRQQRAFFDQGVEHLKPMVLQEIADEIEMHVSTVSRVSNGKYVQTPHGVFELKYFFDGRLEVTDGEDMSSKAVKDMIRRLIDEENKRRPLSDQAIADHLTKEHSIEIARRTVAKYRDQMRIPSARLRKEV
jgi:RNA polymerase sigma-54 factor